MRGASLSTQPEPARFYPAARLVASAFRALRVPPRLSISEAAEKYRVLRNDGGGLSGPWTFDAAPYLRRPMDCLHVDSPYSDVYVQGCAQSGKSEVGNNWLLHTVICDPADMIMTGPDKEILRSYSQQQIARMINASPELRDKLLPTPSADNIMSKAFQGCMFFIVWPTAAQLRARPAPRARIDDYDAVPTDIDGEGNVLVLLGGRQTTFEGFEKTFVNSSPALGAERGIEALVSRGTDERWHVPCPHCLATFELSFGLLDWDRSGTAEKAGETAHLPCPHCGAVLTQRDKPAMMRAGCWAGPEQTVHFDEAAGACIAEGALRRTKAASFRIDGLMGFASWPKLAADCRAAEIVFERTEDEDDLRAFMNARAGHNYVSRRAGSEPVRADTLLARAEASGYRLGEVPDWAVCLTAAVDIQGNRFAVLVKAWGEGLEAAVVDRFDIVALADGTTAMDPARKPEHWIVLLDKVLRRRYPLAGRPDQSLRIMNTAIDTGGVDGVTENAFHFWHTALRCGIHPDWITLVKGGSNPRARLLPPPTVDTKRRLKGNPDPELFVPNVNRMKDMIDGRLRRSERGPLFLHLPSDIDPKHLAEITAEEKIDGHWQRRKGEANETLDLLVYATVALMRHGGTNTSLDWVKSG